MMVSSSSILCYYLLLINFFINEVRSLKLTDFLVPDHAEVGSSITLTCHFDAGTRTLNSVKWYKGEHEFFRYTPSNPDTLADFPADGVHVDLNLSDRNRVTLKNLTFNSTGHYKCEVSTDQPDFELAFDSKNMTVVAFPEWGPVITDVNPEYSVGQKVSANCSVAPSYPSPTLTWEINGRTVDDWYGHTSEELIPGPGLLSSRRSNLQFQADDHHFQGSNQVISLRCRAKLGSVTSSTLETSFTSQLTQSPDSLESAQQRFGSSDAVTGITKNIVALIFLCATSTL